MHWQLKTGLLHLHTNLVVYVNRTQSIVATYRDIPVAEIHYLTKLMERLRIDELKPHSNSTLNRGDIND